MELNSAGQSCGGNAGEREGPGSSLEIKLKTTDAQTYTMRVNKDLIESGEKERLKELLRERLIECGWRDELKAQCRAYTRKRGRANITVDELVRTITPRGRATVPDNVKAELLQRIRLFLTETL